MMASLIQDKSGYGGLIIPLGQICQYKNSLYWNDFLSSETPSPHGLVKDKVFFLIFYPEPSLSYMWLYDLCWVLKPNQYFKYFSSRDLITRLYLGSVDTTHTDMLDTGWQICFLLSSLV